MQDTSIWGIHVTGSAGDKLFVDKGYIAIGWPAVGDLKKLKADRETFKANADQRYPGNSKGWVINAGSQLYRFIHEMNVGDWIVYRSTYYDGNIHVGKIVGPYQFDSTLSSEYPNQRKVKWVKEFLPTVVPQAALNELGSALTLFQLRNYGIEFLRVAQGQTKPVTEEEDEETVLLQAQDVELQTVDFIIKELTRQLKGHGLEDFVADLLRTMGYRTLPNEKGPDGGVDILAYRDELRLAPPIIKVQVKSSEYKIGREEIQKLGGTLENGEYGLFIALGGFNSNAETFAKARTNIRLLNGPQFVRLVLDHYNDLHPRYKSIIPLKQVFIPSPRLSGQEG